MSTAKTTTETQTVNLAILGYGKMGRMIAQLSEQRGCRVRLAMDIDVNEGGSGITPENFREVDVCIDFTTPEAAVTNIERVAAVGCNLVVGTTGWQSELPRVRKIIEKAGVGMVHAANFSIGMQLFYRLTRLAAEVFSQFPQYDPFLTERHHQFKKDAPSGTAIALGKMVGEKYPGRKFSIPAVRAGFFPGAHEVGFDSEADTIELRHTARSRQGFAEGALYAARWVAGKKGLFEFSEILPGKENHHVGSS